MNFIIETKKLTKVFSSSDKKVVAVNNLNLTVKQGEIFGLLGPNGAGKTTTMRMLTTLLKPTSGSAVIAGFDLFTQEDNVRLNIGYVSQAGGLERSATARENLVLQGEVYGFSKAQAQERAQQLIEALGLESFADRLVDTYSGGQRRRVDIALGMVHHPRILFLDEPTVGLDPHSRALMWQEIKKLRSSGTTVILTTHYLDEADALCDRIAIVDHGTIVAVDTPQALKRSTAKDIIILKMHAPTESSLSDIFAHLSGISNVIHAHDEVRLLVDHGEALLPQVLKACHVAGIELAAISLQQPTLDDVFLAKTGRSFSNTAEGA